MLKFILGDRIDGTVILRLTSYLRRRILKYKLKTVRFFRFASIALVLSLVLSLSLVSFADDAYTDGTEEYYSDDTGDTGDTYDTGDTGNYYTDDNTGDYSTYDSADYTADTDTTGNTDGTETGTTVNENSENSENSGSTDVAGAGRNGANSSASESVNKTFTDNTQLSGQREKSVNVTGVVMWVLVLISVILIIVYMIFAGIRERKEKRQRRRNKNPKLIISSGYVRNLSNYDDIDDFDAF